MSSNISGDLFTYIPQRKHAKPDRRVIKRQTTLRPFTIKLPSAQQTSQKDSSLKRVDSILPPQSPVASVHLSPSQEIGQGFQTSTPVRPKEKIPKIGFSPSQSPDFVRVDPCSPPPSSQTEQIKELSLTHGLLRAPEVLETPTSDKKCEIQARKLSYFSSTSSSNSLSPVIRNIQQDLTLSVIEDREKKLSTFSNIRSCR
ncbi:uncharacterized protein LOC143234506 [Tachypleus tridentatus]|uniref:uncharacterized protein LOC143234506 n=1 Tax=Tachypleus tridentatus TaxID=6853 RepID=UPI003FD31BE0